MISRALFHTQQEKRIDSQPYFSRGGNIFAMRGFYVDCDELN